MLTLTWCHCFPAGTPAGPCNTAISNEHQLDNVACACYVGWQGGAAALLHQGCSVTVRNCQVVEETGGMVFNVKCSELQRKDQPLLHLYRLCLIQMVWVVGGVVW